MKFFRLPFAGKLEIVLLTGILIGFCLIAQNVSVDLYRCGLILLMVSALLQTVAGNIPPDSRLVGTLLRLLLGLTIVAGVFAVGIWLVPILANLGNRPS
ncbi:MAG: hypothetical protein JO015_13040 [Verrucomicrobia bacterium]|nr:hypothetical protein [Verrucomicrobiota bacterium]